ncbi:oligosaccharide flippase family protein [Mameliella sp. CS4]|uniref:oligosaccharide flippase family protein n=1 Tax=Mameliella sp. CS4 TaxID=2862329 RepID=UPI001C5E6687|nr:oligosaccharide flippase family protein [Mameliella sp. CS4]MBW4985699.1 oligosaccharide flippase family protein [Mameliella sp. CS4]
MAMGSFRRVTTSPFLRSVSILSGGSALSMAVPILAAPVLGRLYAPAEYGALAQYMAFSAILAVLSTLQFQHAIIAEGSLRAARQIVWLCLACAAGAALLVLVGVALAWPLGLSKTAAGAWIWMLPVSVLVAGVTTSGTFMANRMGRYRRMAAVPFLQTLTTVTLSITLGFAGWGSAGLLSAYFAGQMLQALAFVTYLRGASLGTIPAPALLWRRARRHWKFPAFTLPTGLAGQLNMQIPVFALTALGAHAAVGSFARARQLVSLPVTALGGAVSQVFRRDAAKQYHQTGSCRKLMLRTASGLFFLGLGPCLLFIAFAPWLFTVYLGPKWREAGEIAQILAPMLLLQTVVAPVTTIYYIVGRQGEDFALTLISMAIMATGIVAAVFLRFDPKSVILIYSAVFSVVYIVYLARSFTLSKRPDQ